MRKAALLLAILLSVTLMAAGQTRLDERIESEIRTASGQLAEALEKGDVAGLEKLVADDYTGLNSYARDLGSKTQLINAYRAQAKTGTRLEPVNLADVKMLIGDDDNVMVISRSKKTGKFDGQTFLWHKRLGQWQVFMITSEIRSAQQH